jgi:hypothetical protein
MPDLHNYASIDVTIDSYNRGDQFQVPFDMAIGNQFAEGFSKASGVMMGEQAYINQLNSKMVDATTGEEVENPWISAAEAKQRYGINTRDGQKITELAAQRLAELKYQEQYRQEVISRASQDFGTQFWGGAAQFAGAALDPLNIGLAFVPVVGEARALMLMKQFGPMAGRFLGGLADNLVTGGIVEIGGWNAAKTLDYDYTAYDAFLNIAAGGIIGGGFHVVGGAIADHFGFSTWARELERGKISPDTHFTALRTAVGQILQDQNVSISPIVRAAMANNLDKISAVRLIKDAESSAAVFEKNFQAQDFINRNFEEVSSLLDDTEKQIMSATSTNDIVEGQIALGSQINDLTVRIEELQTVIEQAAPHQRHTLSNQMASLVEQLNEKQQLFDDLLEARKMLDEAASQEVPVTKRSDLDVEALAAEETDSLVLNLEKYKDKDLSNIDFSKVKGEIDRVLLRKAVLEAQNFNKLDSVTPDELLELATKQNSLENKWYYDKEGADAISNNLKEGYKNFDVDDAKKALEKVQKVIDTLPEEFLEGLEEQLAKLDDNIAKSNEMEKIYQQAATCILESIL